MSIRVHVLGRPHVGDPEHALQPRGLKSWALFARVALTDRPLSRRELAAELFFDANDPLGALRWSLAELRRSLELPESLRGDPVRLTSDDIWLDVWALEAGALPVAELGGTLLDGVDLRNCPSFDAWLLLARSRCAVRTMEELRRRALDLLPVDPEAAAAVAGPAARLDPLDEHMDGVDRQTVNIDRMNHSDRPSHIDCTDRTGHLDGVGRIDRADRVERHVDRVDGMDHIDRMDRGEVVDAGTAAARLHDAAVRADLPGFLAWALVHQAELGDLSRIPLARTAANGIDNPQLQERIRALGQLTAHRPR